MHEFGLSKSEFPVFLNAIFIDSIEMSSTNRTNCSSSKKIADLSSGDLSINQSNEPISANLAALYGSNSCGSPDPNFSHVQECHANQLKKAKITPSADKAMNVSYEQRKVNKMLDMRMMKHE